MIGDYDERYEIYPGSEDNDFDKDGVTYQDSPADTIWGIAIAADSRVRERFDSMDSDITHTIKLQGEPTLEYAKYKLVRVGDSKEFEPTEPPIRKGKYNKRTLVAVKEI